jgi:23S rRNA pseudouridine1911/1915/1917 synthase
VTRYTVTGPIALGDCLAKLLGEASGRTRKQMLAGGRVSVNGTVVQRANAVLARGDVVEIGAKRALPVLPSELRLVHEDDDVLVIDKPAGMLTIATERERLRTAYAHLRAYLRTQSKCVFVVHRLDRLASGLLVFATSPEAKQTLQAQFAAHSAERVYVAVVEGRLERPSGSITSRLIDHAPGRVRETRDPTRGRSALTHWRVVRAGRGHTLVEIQLETGRRNQIRVHLAGLGHPIAGDAAYGGRSDPFGRLALHAQALGFDHPRSGVRMRFVSPAPAAWNNLPA